MVIPLRPHAVDRDHDHLVFNGPGPDQGFVVLQTGAGPLAGEDGKKGAPGEIKTVKLGKPEVIADGKPHGAIGGLGDDGRVPRGEVFIFVHGLEAVQLGIAPGFTSRRVDPDKGIPISP